MQIVNFSILSITNPLPREFQLSTWADSSRASSFRSTDCAELTSWGMDEKYPGTRISSPFSSCLVKITSALKWTQIDLQHKRQNVDKLAEITQHDLNDLVIW